jgi:acetaldehyde dehydrogenase/alcohol dehydrogenase
MNAAIVGKSPAFIAERAGIQIPAGTRLLVARQTKIGREYPLSCEILAPVIAYYVAKDFDHAVNICIDLNFLGGKGHTVSLHSNDEAKIKEFSMLMNAGRIVVNMPSSQGGVGGLYNSLHPSFTLGCGSGGRNITTDNVTARNLLNIQRVARRRVNRRFEKFDTQLYFDERLEVDDVVRIFNRNY